VPGGIGGRIDLIARLIFQAGPGQLLDFEFGQTPAGRVPPRAANHRCRASAAPGDRGFILCCPTELAMATTPGGSAAPAVFQLFFLVRKTSAALHIDLKNSFGIVPLSLDAGRNTR
jgi:hypothetical protein